MIKHYKNLLFLAIDLEKFEKQYISYIYIFHIYSIFDCFPLLHCHLLRNNKLIIAQKNIRRFFYFLLKYKLIFDNFLFLIEFFDCAEHNGLAMK